MSGDLDRVRAAVEGGDWLRALELLDGLGEAGDAAAALELRAAAAYGCGQLEACVAAWEALHSASLAVGDEEEAARAAAMVALHLLIDTGLMAPVRAWLRTAARLVAHRTDSPVHAMVAMVRTYERFLCGDVVSSRAEAERAIELGQRLEVPPAVVIGRVASARIAVLEGDVAAGLDQLDDVAALLMSGRVDPLTTGMMYCELICAAQGLALYDRAAEWTEVMERWRHGAAFGGIHGRCRVHRAEMLRMSGPADAAEAEALAACAELRPWMRREFGWPLAELGNARLRRGDLGGAEEAFRAAHDHGWCPHPGLARVHLAKGDIASAAALIDDAIRNPLRAPSKERPPSGDLFLAPLLDGQVEIAVAAGDLDTARGASRRLSSIAAAFPQSPFLVASARLAEARTALCAGDLATAIAAATEAVVGWGAAGAPYEVAIARTVLGDAHERDGSPALARMQRRAASEGFASFGAPPPGHPAPGPGAPRVPHAATFAIEAGLRRIAFGDQEVRLRDLKGFRYLERMLASANRELHVLDLVAADGATPPSPRAVGPGDEVPVGRGDAGLPVIDREARQAYRRRLQEVEQDLEDAHANHDLGRVELAERDREFLLAELSGAVGLGGRSRTTGGSAERARGSVGRCIRYAICQLDDDLPDLAEHLRTSLQIGTYCAYRPDPLASVAWTTTATA